MCVRLRRCVAGRTTLQKRGGWLDNQCDVIILAPAMRPCVQPLRHGNRARACLYWKSAGVFRGGNNHFTGGIIRVPITASQTLKNSFRICHLRRSLGGRRAIYEDQFYDDLMRVTNGPGRSGTGPSFLRLRLIPNAKNGCRSRGALCPRLWATGL